MNISTTEAAGSVTVCVNITSGSLGRDVVVTIETMQVLASKHIYNINPCQVSLFCMYSGVTMHLARIDMPH